MMRFYPTLKNRLVMLFTIAIFRCALYIHIRKYTFLKVSGREWPYVFNFLRTSNHKSFEKFSNSWFFFIIYAYLIIVFIFFFNSHFLLIICFDYLIPCNIILLLYSTKVLIIDFFKFKSSKSSLALTLILHKANKLQSLPLLLFILKC